MKGDEVVEAGEEGADGGLLGKRGSQQRHLLHLREVNAFYGRPRLPVVSQQAFVVDYEVLQKP